MSDQTQPSDKATVLLYSDDRTVREQVRLALGRRIAADLPDIEDAPLSRLDRHRPHDPSEAGSHDEDDRHPDSRR